MKEIKEVNAERIRFSEVVEETKGSVENMLGSKVKFVGFRLFFLDEEDDIVSQVGFFAEGFDPEEYE